MEKQDSKRVKVDDRIQFQNYLDPGAITVKKPRHELRNMVLNQAQDYAEKQWRNFGLTIII